MAAVIILCFSLTIFSILTINSYESSKIEQQTSLNNATDSALHASQLDKKYNKDNYEELANDLLQNIILQSEANGVLNVKILEVNTKEGLLDVLVNKQYYWLGTKKTIETRRTVVLEEFGHPTNIAEPVTSTAEFETNFTVTSSFLFFLPIIKISILLLCFMSVWQVE